MLFKVTKIEFDFEMEDDMMPPQDYKNEVISKTLDKTWEVDEEEDLVDHISDETGWCIKSIDYHQVENRTISLKKFHDFLSDSYAVVVNDTLYFVGYDTDDNPYIADNDGQDYVDLSITDGDIELVGKTAVFFTINGEPISMSFLELMKVTV